MQTRLDDVGDENPDDRDDSPREVDDDAADDVAGNQEAYNVEDED